MEKLRNYLLITLFCCLSTTVSGQDKLLDQADSLFSIKKYTESFKLYDSIYHTSGKATQAMLLKMAFIKEGIKDFPKALFYLNKYYRLSNDRKAVVQMNEIAEEQGYKGYELSDENFFKNLFIAYEIPILTIFIIILIGIFGFIASKKIKKQPIPQALMVTFFSLLLLTSLLANYNVSPKMGIVQYENAPLMLEPSSGADVVSFLTSGDRYVINGKNDVWYAIDLDNQEDGFVREQNLLIIE